MPQNNSKDDLDRTLMLTRQLEARCLALGVESSVRHSRARLEIQKPDAYKDPNLNQALRARRTHALDLAPLSSERVKQDDAKFKRELLEISTLIKTKIKADNAPRVDPDKNNPHP